jgi:hypothetical protein
MQDEREGELEPNVRQKQETRGPLTIYFPLNFNLNLCNKKNVLE